MSDNMIGLTYSRTYTSGSRRPHNAKQGSTLGMKSLISHRERGIATHMLYGGIEAGGTKMVCAVGTSPADLSAPISFPTTTPSESLARIISYFQQYQLTAVGIGAFGPISPDPHAPDYGYITTTPKPGWAQTDIVGTIGRALGVPVGFDTDVNTAALGEGHWGAAQGLSTFIYLTVGTGIGGGGLSN